MTINKHNTQGFSDCEADEKSRLDEALRRGMGRAGRCERSRLAILGDGDWITILLQLSLARFAGACAELDRTSFEPCNEVS
jgi:hypothetical protein